MDFIICYAGSLSCLARSACVVARSCQADCQSSPNCFSSSPSLHSCLRAPVSVSPVSQSHCSSIPVFVPPFPCARRQSRAYHAVRCARDREKFSAVRTKGPGAHRISLVRTAMGINQILDWGCWRFCGVSVDLMFGRDEGWQVETVPRCEVAGPGSDQGPGTVADKCLVIRGITILPVRIC